MLSGCGTKQWIQRRGKRFEVSALFKYVPWDVNQLVTAVDTGTVTLPDLQRPFVWSATKVRDLFDSMYRGYPVGQLMFWQTGAEAGARKIGVGDKTQVATHAIVDGQQRLTSLFAVMTGESVIREDYRAARIRIAFNPFTERFEVATPATDKSPEWVSSITDLFKNGPEVIDDFVDDAAERHDLSREDARKIRQILNKVSALDRYQFTVVDLDKEADEEQVAEIFVRINSEGISLNQADFILTLMSVYWEDGRKDLEEFSRSARELPTEGKPTAFNWHLKPKPEELLRVVIAVGLGRGRLKNAYSALRGRDIVTGKIDMAKREEQFALLVAAQKNVLNLLHWTEFLKCLERAGYRSEKLISGKNTILYSYAMWLIGRTQFGMPVADLREIIARWFFMSALTARYSGSFESTVDQDLLRFTDAKANTPAEFTRILQQQIDASLTSDYWTVTLPNELDSSASRSPALFGYIAALNVLDADALLSTLSVRAWLDPATLALKGLERHHLFPKKYLSSHLGITNSRQVNHIANFALVEWSDNISISDEAPSVYWPAESAKKLAGGLTEQRLAQQQQWHALPEDWQDMTYEEFLSARRALVAGVIHEAYRTLTEKGYEPSYPAVQPPAESKSSDDNAHTEVTLQDLLGSGLLQPGELITPTAAGYDAIAEVMADGTILLDGMECDSLTGAAAAAGARANGWTFWAVSSADGEKSLNHLRKEYVAAGSDDNG